jgi:hypothetical protein
MAALESNRDIIGIISSALTAPKPLPPGLTDGGAKLVSGMGMMGFDQTLVPGSSSLNVTKRPQLIFKPKYLFIPPSIAKDVMVIDLKIGKNSQTVAYGEMPGESFSSLGLITLKCDTCQVGMDITVQIRNKNTQQIQFEATLFGDYTY